MAFDAATWLDSLGVTGDERAAALAILSKPERVAKLEKSVSMQADYSRNMDSLREKEAALAKKLEDAEADLEGQRRTLSDWRTDAEGTLVRDRTRVTELERQLLETQQAMRKVADEHGIDPAELKIEVKPPVDDKKTVEPAANDLIDGIRKEVGTSLVGLSRLPAMLMGLNVRHRKLFGDDIPDPEALVNQVLEANSKGKALNLEEAWKAAYKVDARQAEVAAADFSKKVDDEVEVRMRKKLEDGALGDVSPSEHAGSPILKRFGAKRPDQNDRPRHNGETAADAARRSFAGGKHREEAKRIARSALAG